MNYFNIAITLAALHMTNGGPLDPKISDLSPFFQSSRIVGGEDAPKSYHYFQGALVFGDLFRGILCGSSLVQPNILLTAAHCIEPFIWWTGQLMETVRAIVGTKDWENKGIEVEFLTYHIHPEWNASVIKNDIGAMVLKKHLKISEHVRPVAISYREVPGDEQAFVTGWGTTSLWGEVPKLLQLLYVRILSPEECLTKFRAVTSEELDYPPIDSRVEICTFHSVGRGMCHGDSGSALISVKDEKVVGIVSWGIPCAEGGPDMYARMSAYEDFMTEVFHRFN